MILFHSILFKPGTVKKVIRQQYQSDPLFPDGKIAEGFRLSFFI